MILIFIHPGSRILDPGVKKGTGPRIRNTGYNYKSVLQIPDVYPESRIILLDSKLLNFPKKLSSELNCLCAALEPSIPDKQFRQFR
jgi:hypothetical protein